MSQISLIQNIICNPFLECFKINSHSIFYKVHCNALKKWKHISAKTATRYTHIASKYWNIMKYIYGTWVCLCVQMFALRITSHQNDVTSVNTRTTLPARRDLARVCSVSRWTFYRGQRRLTDVNSYCFIAMAAIYIGHRHLYLLIACRLCVCALVYLTRQTFSGKQDAAYRPLFH